MEVGQQTPGEAAIKFLGGPLVGQTISPRTFYYDYWSGPAEQYRTARSEDFQATCLYSLAVRRVDHRKSLANQLCRD